MSCDYCDNAPAHQQCDEHFDKRQAEIDELKAKLAAYHRSHDDVSHSQKTRKRAQRAEAQLAMAVAELDRLRKALPRDSCGAASITETLDQIAAAKNGGAT